MGDARATAELVVSSALMASREDVGATGDVGSTAERVLDALLAPDVVWAIAELSERSESPDAVLAARMAVKIAGYLRNRGWKADDQGFSDEHGDHRVDLSQGTGFVWALQDFDDSDRDGVATARWTTVAEGDGLELLEKTLKAPRCRVCHKPAIPGHRDRDGVMCKECSFATGFREVERT